jgi:hypothetical protein
VIEGKSVPKLSATALFFTTVIAKISVDLSTLFNKEDFFENYTNFLIASLLVVMLTYYLFMISNINLRLYKMFEQDRVQREKDRKELDNKRKE